MPYSRTELNALEDIIDLKNHARQGHLSQYPLPHGMPLHLGRQLSEPADQVLIVSTRTFTLSQARQAGGYHPPHPERLPGQDPPTRDLLERLVPKEHIRLHLGRLHRHDLPALDLPVRAAPPERMPSVCSSSRRKQFVGHRNFWSI